MKKTTLPAAAVNDRTQEPATNETIQETVPETLPETAYGNDKDPVTELDPGEAANTEAGDGPSKSQADDIEARIAEAENRGYMRGRNERIAELMRQPALFERQTSPSARDAPGGMAADSPADSQPMILNNPRVSIWDR
ncbi:MAG: hypothetical protein K1V88_02140 [Muribaculaceae bacterium]|jgi:hypothetical protein